MSEYVAALRTSPHDLGIRLERDAAEIEDLDDQLRAARERRDGHIVEAVDEGMSTAKAARHAHISQSRVMSILAASADRP
jgi:hypothetical protein